MASLSSPSSSYLFAAQRPASDWTQWRGPNRDGVAPAPSDAQAWPEKLNQKWKLEVGLGYATPLVVGNRIYQFARKGEREVMMGIDADSGKVLWETGYEAKFTMMSATVQHGPGPKATPVFSNGRLYSIGMTGIVTAYDAASGKQLWQKPGSSLCRCSRRIPSRRSSIAVWSSFISADTMKARSRHSTPTRATYDGAGEADGPGYGSPVWPSSAARDRS